jgi:S-adenosylmethionine-dependent methyltransferase
LYGATAEMTEATKLDRVRTYYASFDEWGRLDSPEGVRELARASEILTENLPPNSRILDLGGGPGRYAIALARSSHRVVLADLSRTQLDIARGKVAEAGMSALVESYDEVNATDLSIYADASFDAVVAFGPFYHLTSDAERRQTAREIRRVLTLGGHAFVAFVPRVAGLMGLIDRAATTPAQVSVDAFRAAADVGVFSNTATSGFQEGYYPTPTEMAQLFESSGFHIDDMLSLKSIACDRGTQVARLDASLQSEVERIARKLCRQPEVIATSGHALLIASHR